MPGDMQKYLFDRHNFDVGAIDPDNPPPPTYNDADLTAARHDSFAKGQQKGLEDGKASRDQQILDLTRKMTAELATLTTNEADRAARFEHELMTLVVALYQKTFPILNTAYGIPQITATIKDTLGNLADQSTVQIEVAPQDLDEVSDRLKGFFATHDGQITLITGSDLETGQFRMKWQDGGAIRDPHALADQLTAALAQTLAEPPQNPHTSVTGG